MQRTRETEQKFKHDNFIGRYSISTFPPLFVCIALVFVLSLARHRPATLHLNTLNSGYRYVGTILS